MIKRKKKEMKCNEVTGQYEKETRLEKENQSNFQNLKI